MDLHQIRCDCECRNSRPLEINPTFDIEDPRLVGTSCSNIVPVSTSSVDVCANFCKFCFQTKNIHESRSVRITSALYKHAGMSFWKKNWQLPRSLSTSSIYMGVSKNRGTPKSSILIGFSIINHPFWGAPIFGNTHIFLCFRISNSPTSPTLRVAHRPSEGIGAGCRRGRRSAEGTGRCWRSPHWRSHWWRSRWRPRTVPVLHGVAWGLGFLRTGRQVRISSTSTSIDLR